MGYRLEIAAERLIIALDDLDFVSAIKLAELTKPYAKTFKVGLSLFSGYGQALVSALNSLGVGVFLDLKLCDIPMQVEKTIEALRTQNLRFLTVHAFGGSAMLKAAHEAVLGSGMTILSVAVLTSLSQEEFGNLGFAGSVESGVLRLSGLAYEAGIRGFISSPHEVARLKHALGSDAYVVCPGIRASFDHHGDQVRTMSATEALAEGADALVVGRPITKAKNPVTAAEQIHLAITQALNAQQTRR